MAQVAKMFTFSAGHHLPGHKGKCARPHGHNYKVTIVQYADIRNEPGESDYGMVVDFDDVTTAMKPLLEVVDHYDLNEVLPIKRTTAELIALWFMRGLNAKNFWPGEVIVDETDNCCASVTQKDLAYGYNFFTDTDGT
jgi:6-pyruvoyltetrahydropterin/6-carboxytetrahydropterin synthase